MENWRLVCLDNSKRERLKVISFDKEKNVMIELEQKLETFADVGGMEDVKKKIRMDFIMPIQSPEFFQAFGKELGGGLLFYGPPGCGKHLLQKQ